MKVTLPTGTQINIRMSWTFIGSITIKPSYHDVNEAKGLCGIPNIIQDPSDDYTERHKGTVSSSQVFAKSWR